MCGIAGIFDPDGGPIERTLIERMNARLHHRGPDAGGVHIEPGVGLGHRRLAIIDLSGGVQPLANEDGSVVVVYNGEIYNFHGLADELTRRGHRFRTRCDTEVIVHAWEQWGADCVQRFRGMFAFALWDRNRRTLFLARDRLGIKPLHYAVLPSGRLVFASELKALYLHPDLPRVMDPLAVEDYLAYGYIPAPRTILAGVHKLPPGHHLSLTPALPPGRLPTPVRYWDVAFKTGSTVDPSDAAAELIERLREAVRIRLIAEVPLGAFLSGGVDSSAVVALMAGLSDDQVLTCSIAFGDTHFNEATYAAQVAERYRTAHRVEQVDANAVDLIDRLAELYDEPYADSSALPTYHVCELARRQVTVALSGDGGDENLAGYRRYQWQMRESRLRGLMPPALRRPLFAALGHAYPKLARAPRIMRAKSTLKAMARDDVAGYFDIIAVLKDDMRRRLYSAPFRRQLGGYRAVEVLRHHAGRAPTEDPLSLIQYLDIKTYLVDDILTKVDRASMAHGLEVRVPLLDHALVEWCASLPSALKLSRGQGKALLKTALRPLLPDDLLYRPKQGFAVPLAAWLRGPLREHVHAALLGPTLADTGLFNRTYLSELIAHHENGRCDYSASLWSLLMFEAHLRRFRDGAANPA